MKTHETPPPDQPEWDAFLAEAKSTIDRHTRPRETTTRFRRPTVRRLAPIVAVSVLALGAVLIVGNHEEPNRPIAESPGSAVTTAPPERPPGPFRASGPQYATAGEVLTAASVSSASQVSDVAGAPYWRVESAWRQINSDPAADPAESDSGTRIIWQGRTASSVLFQDGTLAKLPPASFSMQRTSFSWGELAELTTSPTELAELLESEASGLRGDHDQYILKFIGELLAESPASPTLRSALWKVAADLGDATLDGKARDAAGRDGWSITVGDLTVIVEPQTGRILESRHTTGTTSYTSTTVSSGPAAAAPRSVDEIRPSS